MAPGHTELLVLVVGRIGRVVLVVHIEWLVLDTVAGRDKVQVLEEDHCCMVEGDRRGTTCSDIVM